MGENNIIVVLEMAFFCGAMCPDKTTVIMSAMDYQTEIRGMGQGFSNTRGEGSVV